MPYEHKTEYKEKVYDTRDQHGRVKTAPMNVKVGLMNQHTEDYRFATNPNKLYDNIENLIEGQYWNKK